MRILVVEDEKDLRNIIKETFGKESIIVMPVEMEKKRWVI